MQSRTINKFAALRQFQAADTAWGEELKRLFGPNAGDIRYTKAGQGEPDINLLALYKRREAARLNWEKARDR